MPELKILGGKPAFGSPLPFTRPTMPDFDKVAPRLREIFSSGMITLDKSVRELETRVAAYLGVRHIVAMSSNSTGQMLTLRAWGLRGEVIVPSFSFCMTSHVLLWNGLEPVFVDVDPETCTVDPRRVEEAITPRTCAIMGAHVWGNPCRADELRELARRRGLKFITDAAQAMGSRLKGRPVGGWADAEVFSCSPTKLLTCGEGGLVSTDDDELASRLRRARAYGLKPDYDSDIVGLNARMSEMNAALGVASFEALEANMAMRKERFALYQKRLAAVPGVTLPEPTPGAEPNGIYFTFYVDEERFGLSRDELYGALLSENIMAKKYFDPPLHRLSVNAGARRHDLPVTERMCRRVLTLPLYSHSTVEMIETVSDVVARIQRQAPAIRAALKKAVAAA
jgi:dTDP-4-amino-4,6-dideoxygalactose transaminase